MKTLAPLAFLLAALPALAAQEDFAPKDIPEDIARAHLEADRVLTEKPCKWREAVGAIAKPLAKDCKTPREAALSIAANIGRATGVYYSMERRKPDMNALEALKEKKVSCTGQSILLVCALRSVGLPARAVGIPTWNHVRGNHTWAEVWFEGEWHMIEFNEKEFNTPWVMENIGMLDARDPWQHIYAVADKETGTAFPMYDESAPRLPAEDVTARYRALSAAWYARHGLEPDEQRLMVDCVPRTGEPGVAKLVDEQGHVLEEEELPSAQDDVRHFATFSLPRRGRSFLVMPGAARPVEVRPTEGPVRLLRFRRKSS